MTDDGYNIHFSAEKYGLLEQYAEQHSSAGPALLDELVRATWQRSVHPRMLSGEFQGRILAMVSRLVCPRRILEIGTFTGYSALCLAEGLARDGELITIDRNEELEDFANSFFDRSPFAGRIKMRIGDARKVIPTLEGRFDLVFIDGDKSDYLEYLDAAAPRMNPGGVLISDNVLWNGKVVEPGVPGDTDTAVIKEYNRRLACDPRFETVLLPVRDGLTLSRRTDYAADTEDKRQAGGLKK